MKILFLMAVLSSVSVPALAGGGGGSGSGNACESRVTKILDSKVITLRNEAGKVQAELEESSSQCAGGKIVRSISVLLKMMDPASSGRELELAMIAVETHGNPYNPNTNPATRRIGSEASLLNFCPFPATGTVVNCTRLFVASSEAKSGELAPVNDIETNSYHIALLGELFPRTVLSAEPRK